MNIIWNSFYIFCFICCMLILMDLNHSICIQLHMRTVPSIIKSIYGVNVDTLYSYETFPFPYHEFQYVPGIISTIYIFIYIIYLLFTILGSIIIWPLFVVYIYM